MHERIILKILERIFVLIDTYYSFSISKNISSLVNN